MRKSVRTGTVRTDLAAFDQQITALSNRYRGYSMWVKRLYDK